MASHPPAQVIQLLRDSRCTVAFDAAAEMKRVGAAGVPAVLKMLDDPDPLVERVGMIAAANIGTPARAALPHALQIIRASDPAKPPKLANLARLESAILAVGGFGTAASEAVPLLLPYLQRTERYFSSWDEAQKASPLCFGSDLASAAALSLSRIGPAAAVALPALRALATRTGPEGFQFPWVLADIGRMRPVTTAAVDALVGALDPAHIENSYRFVAPAVSLMYPEGASALLEVAQRSSTHPVARAMLLATLSRTVRERPGSPVALASLIAMAPASDTLSCVEPRDYAEGRRQGTCRKQALFYLRAVKTPEVATLFRGLLRDDDPQIAQYAREALKP